MDSPLQQSALEPLEPMGWLLLLAGVVICGWCFRPVAQKHAISESLAFLSGSSPRQASRVTPDRKTRPPKSRAKRSKSREPADEAARRAALKAAVKANVARMTRPPPHFIEEPGTLGVHNAEGDPAFQDTVLTAPHPHVAPSRRRDRAEPATRARSDDNAASTTDHGDISRGDFASAVREPASIAAHAAAQEGPTLREAPPTDWNLRVFQLIEWRRFEAVVEELFSQAGFKTRPQKHRSELANAEGGAQASDNATDAYGDGGVDIWLYSRHARRAVSVVQCKHSQGRAVSVGELNRFLAVMNSHDLRRGTYATTSTFTADALAFASGHGIHAMDGSALLELIRMRTEAQQRRLLDIAFEGEYWRPTCSNCSVKLVQRGNADNGSLFWGCTNFPDCRMRLPMAA